MIDEEEIRIAWWSLVYKEAIFVVLLIVILSVAWRPRPVEMRGRDQGARI